ncbi:MAG TPA: YpdA family putative bacillithiol disulfide reductase [Trueperaceae bacterium]|nr:YpdA family putative bacillithiol disulfide reductase [Trueperaceae bacterium]
MPVRPTASATSPDGYDVVIVGAGPIGLECAIQAQRAGLTYAVLDKGPVVAAIAKYPTYMTFFTTSERLEIGGHPLVTATDKPTRKEALDYYRKVVANAALNVRTCSEVTAIRRLSSSRGFALTVAATAPSGLSATVRASVVMIATGYFDNPNMLLVPGEDGGMVSHHYTEGHQYFGRPVVVVGGGSSAADAALDLYRAGALVTMVHRGTDFKKSLKYWIRPNLENRIKEGSIAALFESVVTEVQDGAVKVAPAAGRHGSPATPWGTSRTVLADHVFALTGYYAPTDLLESVGAAFDPVTLAAVLDQETRESTVPGLYVVGSAGCGRRTSDVFIENGLVHASQAMTSVVQRVATAQRAGRLTPR